MEIIESTAKSLAEGIQRMLDRISELVPEGSSERITVSNRKIIRECVAEVGRSAATMSGMLTVTEALRGLEAGSSRAIAAPEKSRSNAKRTYASVAKKCEVVIETTEEQTSEEVKTSLKEKIDVSELGIGVSKLVKLPKGGVKVSCTSEQDLELFKEAVSRKTKLKVRASAKRLPWVKFHGIPRGTTDEEFLETAYKQNAEIRGELKTASDLKKELLPKLNFYSRKNNEKKTVVAQVSTRVYNILKVKPLKFGFDCVWSADFLEPVKCFKCFRYGHKARECKNEAVCRKCAKTGHKMSECKAATPKCAACGASKDAAKLKKDHWVGSRDCPTLKSLEERTRRETLYDP